MSDRPPVRRPAAFTPTPPQTPVCPACWSRPQLGPTRTVRRGWRVQADEVELTPGTTLAVATSVYPCSNPACDTAIVVRSALSGGYVARDMEDGSLRDADASAFLRGRISRDGIWRDRLGEPRTAPAQRDLFAM